MPSGSLQEACSVACGRLRARGSLSQTQAIVAYLLHQNCNNTPLLVFPPTLDLLRGPLSASQQQQSSFSQTLQFSVHQINVPLLFSPKQVAHTGLIRAFFLWKQPAAAARC